MADGNDVVRQLVFDSRGRDSNVDPMMDNELFEKHHRTGKTRHNASRVFDFEEITTGPYEPERHRGVMKIEADEQERIHVTDSNPISMGIRLAIEDENVDETDPFPCSEKAGEDTNESSLTKVKANELAMEDQWVAKTDPILPNTKAEDDGNETSLTKAEINTVPSEIDIEPDSELQIDPDGSLSEKGELVDEVEPTSFSKESEDEKDKISSETHHFPQKPDVAPILISKPDMQRKIEPNYPVVEAKEPASEENHSQDMKATSSGIEGGHENGTSGLDVVQPNLPNMVQVHVTLKIGNRALRLGKKKAPPLVATRDKTDSRPKTISDAVVGETIADQARNRRSRSRKKRASQAMKDDATQEGGARNVRQKRATEKSCETGDNRPTLSAHVREASHRALAKIAAVQYAEAVADDDGISVEDGEESSNDVSINKSKASSQGKHRLIPPSTPPRTGPGDLTKSLKQKLSTVSKSRQAVNKILLGRDDVITSRCGNHVGTKRIYALIQEYGINSSLSSVKDVTARIKRDIRPGRFLHRRNEVWCLSSDDEISMRITKALKKPKIVRKSLDEVVSIACSTISPRSTKRKSTRPTGPSHDSTARAQTALESLVSSQPTTESLEEVLLREKDVLCGDENHSQKGNLHFLKLVKRLASKLKPDSDLTGIVKKVEDIVAPGRFIRKEGEVFIQLDEDQRRAKIIEALQYSVESRFGGTKCAVGSSLQMLPSQSSISSIVSKEEPVSARIKRRSKKTKAFLKSFDKVGSTSCPQVPRCNKEGQVFSPLVEYQHQGQAIESLPRSVKSRFGGEKSAANSSLQMPPSQSTIVSIVGNKELVPAADQSSKTDREKLSEKDDDSLFQTYVEDVAWRKYAVDSVGMEEAALSALPPPNPMPELPTDDPSCTWTFDEETRILRAALKPNTECFSPKAKKFMFLMMERDDIAIITGGHCRNLDASLWNNECIKSKSGERYHHRFRRFRRRINDDDGKKAVDDSEGDVDRNLQCVYEEVDKDLAMSVSDYFGYLEKRQEFFRMSSEARQSVDRQFHYINDVGDDASVDLDEVVYMLDYDIKKKLPSHFEDFKDNFCFPEILPGGQMCAMNTVNEAARPDMGPNLYVTPPGSFTKFHQDGYGTVDSGHLCLSGYNEVIILRRLPRGHDRNAINGDKSSFYEMPHADLLTKTNFEWPKKAQIQHMNAMNYCAIVLVLGPGEHLHIGKGRFHAFRKLGPEMLPEDDCHFDLRKQVHSKLQKENVAINDLVNVSLAWDWSFLGETPEGINREMTSTLEFALRNRGFLKPKQSLAIPKLSLLSRCESSIAALRTQGKTFGINTVVNIQSFERHRNIIRGLLPTLEFVVAQEEEAYKKAQISGTSTLVKNAKPHSWENPVLFPLDPYGNSDYFCRICFQELSNTYMHCDGCEELLKKDFNICADCHSDSKHCQFFIMSEKYDSMDSALNHTGSMLRKSHAICDCIGKDPCVNCGKCRQYSCTCHQKFTLHQRMWKCEKLFEMRANAADIVGGDKVKFFDEVQPRLREARMSMEIADKESTPKRKTRKSTMDELIFPPLTFTGKASIPADHLDISADALAFTAPLLLVEAERPSFTTCFSINLSAHGLYDLVTKARASFDVDVMSSVIGDIGDIGIERDGTVQLLRNFYDCDNLGYSSPTHITFTPREVDIMAYAIMQAVENVPCPTKARLGLNLRTSWGHAAWRLMPYRVRKDITDRFSFRAATNNLEDKFADALANEEYRAYLSSKVGLLFSSALAT